MEKLQFKKPQINLARPTAGRMWLVNLCAFMAVIQSSLSDSFFSLMVALGAVAAAALTEFLILYKNGRAGALKDGSAVASALILTLLLPNKISPVYAAAGAAFAMAVIKHSFGGLGSNWLNPAAGGWLFIRFSWPSAFNRALDSSPLTFLVENIDAGVYSPRGSPLDILNVGAGGLFAPVSSMAGSIRAFLNDTVFSFLGAELPEGYIDLFISDFPGIIADRGVLALVVGTIIMTASQVNRSWIPAVYLVVFSVFVRFAGALPYGGSLWNGDVIFALCSGGTLAAAFFLAADPATGAKSNEGILLAAVAGGGMAFFYRFYGDEPYGAIYTAIIINALLSLVRIFEGRKFYGKPEAGPAGTGPNGPSPGRFS